MAQTIILYLSVLIVSIFLAKRAEHIGSFRKRRLYIVLIISVLSLLAGLRRYDIGLDTYNYVTYFSSGFKSYGGIENGYKILTFFLMSIYQNYTFGLVVIAFLTNTLFVLRFWSLRKLSSFSNSIFVYISMTYFSTFSGIRQLLAVSLVFSGTYFIYEKKKYLLFFVFLFLAVNLHTSSIISVLYIMPLIFVKSHSLKETLRQLFFFIALPIGGYYVYLVLVGNYGSVLYSTRIENVSLGIMLPVRMVSLLCVILLLYLSKRHYVEKADSKTMINDSIEVKHLCFFEFLSLSTSYLYYISSAASRIGWYFAPFTAVLYGYNMKKVNNYRSINAAVKVLSILIPLYYFYASIVSKTDRLVPYYFFWQQQ